ncbi:MAG TPA: DMT family transporter [Streptosporangiaceae bacterium]|jgi:drug/metabolite transporter (DMT)-like permease|nr:DMT family transporter [Streptosporangiaceae bacterium]
MVLVLGLGAALANALTSIFQRKGIAHAPAGAALRLSLITYALRRGIWLAGLGLMIVSFVLQAIALHFGRLSQVQPILTTELVFLAVVLAVWFGFTMGRREWLGVLAVTGGLAGFLYFAHPVEGTLSPPLREWIVTCGASSIAIAIAVVLALRGPRWWRAAMFGSASAVSFALTAACTKVVSGFAAADWATLHRHWQTYALAFFGALGVFLAQNAIHAGPIVASQSSVVLLDPLASILIGVGLFGDNLRTSGAWGPLEAGSLLVMFAGAFSLAHSPMVRRLKDAAGEHHQLPSQRARPAPPPGTARRTG